ncbi:TspO/MBR family protein [Nocardioides insulae]|uniref:TspO/MBR family protein n=1 Tax=Nocardioides insulae TaxID=394734 RepID=UPI00040BA2A6|nr:TspO/MBR family protein [Nocardioides insulae]
MSASTSSTRKPAAWLSLLPFLAAVAAVSILGGLAASGSSQTYRSLELPPFAPPSWLFGPVWTVLYVMIGVAGWLVWRAAGAGPGLWAWIVQLLLNLAWTPLFFASDRYGWALVDIVVLWVAVLVTMVLAWPVSRSAAWLLAPYLAWVGYATALNAGIVVLN